jgi:hypothetical protein
MGGGSSKVYFQEVKKYPNERPQENKLKGEKKRSHTNAAQSGVEPVLGESFAIQKARRKKAKNDQREELEKRRKNRQTYGAGPAGKLKAEEAEVLELRKAKAEKAATRKVGTSDGNHEPSWKIWLGKKLDKWEAHAQRPVHRRGGGFDY